MTNIAKMKAAKHKSAYQKQKKCWRAIFRHMEGDNSDSNNRRSINKWSEANMQQAIAEYNQGEVGLRFVARA